MAVRDLTTNESAVLAHVVLDPIGWWTHANSVVKIDHEAALAAKVAKYQDSYDEAVAGDDYQTLAERHAEIVAA
jgi:hypothetical protein